MFPKTATEKSIVHNNELAESCCSKLPETIEHNYEIAITRLKSGSRKTRNKGSNLQRVKKQVTGTLINARFDECAEAVETYFTKANREAYGILHGKCKSNFIWCFVVITYA